MNNDQNDQFDDLKQFIASTVSQTEERLQNEMTELKREFKGEMSELRKEMADGFTGVGEAIDEIHKQLDVRDKQVDKRLTKLEHQAA